MKSRSEQDQPEPRIIELPHHSHQPSVAELNEDMRADASFEESVRAVPQPVRIRHVVPRRRDPWMLGLRHSFP